MNFIKIAIPIIIILIGSIDFIKALVAQKDDDMKKAQKTFIKRLVYGVVVFFIISIVSFLIGLVGGDTNNRCFKCVANVNGKECAKDKIPVCRKTPVETIQPETPSEPEVEVTPEPEPESEEPTNNCPSGGRVHFSGALITDQYNINHWSQIFTDDGVSEIIYEGEYYAAYSIQESLKGSLDSIAIDCCTRLILHHSYGTLDREGPLIIYNKFRYDYNYFGIEEIMNRDFVGYASLFTPDKRELSTFYFFDPKDESKHYVHYLKIINTCK